MNNDGLQFAVPDWGEAPTSIRHVNLGIEHLPGSLLALEIEYCY